MRLSQLELLCEVERVNSVSKASKLLNKSQQTVVEQLRALENFFGITILEKRAETFLLTDKGHLVATYAREMLRLHDALEKELDSRLPSEELELFIGATPIAADFILPCTVWTFQEKHPALRVEVIKENSDNLLPLLREGKIHLALLEEELLRWEHGFSRWPVFRDNLLVIAPGKSEWTGRGNITIEELKGVPMVLPKQGFGSRSLFEKLLRLEGYDVSELVIVEEMDDVKKIKSAVADGHGLSVCGKASVGKEISAGQLHPLKLKGVTANINYLAVASQETNQSWALKKFLRLISEKSTLRACNLFESDNNAADDDCSC